IMGGVAGVMLGLAVGNGLSILIGGTFVIPWWPILMGILLCVIVGIVSGLYPAVKAAQLDPVDALRYEYTALRIRSGSQALFPFPGRGNHLVQSQFCLPPQFVVGKAGVGIHFLNVPGAAGSDHVIQLHSIYPLKG